MEQTNQEQKVNKLWAYYIPNVGFAAFGDELSIKAFAKHQLTAHMNYMAMMQTVRQAEQENKGV